MTDCVSDPQTLSEQLSTLFLMNEAAVREGRAAQNKGMYEEAKQQSIAGRNVAKELFQIWTAADEGLMTEAAATQSARRVLYRSSAPAPPPAGGDGGGASAVRELKELWALHKEGALSLDEFKQMKASVMGAADGADSGQMKASVMNTTNNADSGPRTKKGGFMRAATAIANLAPMVGDAVYHVAGGTDRGKMKTRDLDDMPMVRKLAHYADGAYDARAPGKPWQKHGNLLAELVGRSPFGNGILHATVFKDETGKLVLAIRGTHDAATGGQCVLVAIAPAALLLLVLECVKWAKKYKVDFVTGHSLGGLLAEAVCSRTGISGACFNGPGATDLDGIFGTDWSDQTRFEVHITKEDAVSEYRNMFHISNPKWHGRCTTIFTEGVLSSVANNFWADNSKHGIEEMCRKLDSGETRGALG